MRQRRILRNDKGVSPTRGYTSISIYAPNAGIPKYVKQILTELKGEIDSNAFILGHFYIPLTPKEKSTRQKISKETEQHIRTDGPNRHLQNTPSKSSRIHILLKCTWNIFHNRSHAR